MNDFSSLGVSPAELGSLSVRQLADLPPRELFEAHTNLNHLIAWAARIRERLDAALVRRFAERARAELDAVGQTFGTVCLREDALLVTVTTAPVVRWDAAELAHIAARIQASGEAVEHYLDVTLSVPESRYASWAPPLQAQFAAARTVEAGSPTFSLQLDPIVEGARE